MPHVRMPKLSRKVRRLIVFLWAWGILAYFDMDSDEALTWKRIAISFLLASLIMIANTIIIDRDSVAYVRLEHEESIVRHLLSIGYESSTQNGDKLIFIKKGNWFSPKIKMNKTPYHIQIHAPNHMLKQFEQFV